MVLSISEGLNFSNFGNSPCEVLVSTAGVFSAGFAGCVTWAKTWDTRSEQQHMKSRQRRIDTSGAANKNPGFCVAGHRSSQAGSPIYAFNDTWEHMVVFLVPVRQWSDGTADQQREVLTVAYLDHAMN